MLTIPMVRSRRPRLADLDPMEITRSTAELATRDLPELVRRADVPGRLETGMDVASDAIRTAVERMPGRRRRSRRRLPVFILVIVSVLTTVAITAWWKARGAALSAARELDRELDDEALDRAATEGMSGDPDARRVPHGLSPDGTPSNGTAAELARSLPV